MAKHVKVIPADGGGNPLDYDYAVAPQSDQPRHANTAGHVSGQVWMGCFLCVDRIVDGNAARRSRVLRMVGR